MQSNHFIVLMNQLFRAYQNFCDPLCRELQMTQTAFDILMFLDNNPDYNTAGEISKMRGIKANVVSFTVDKLVTEGYLERHLVPGDRRKVGLTCTEKARPILTRGHEVQESFGCAILDGMSEESLRAFSSYLNVVEENVAHLNAPKGTKKRTDPSIS